MSNFKTIIRGSTPVLVEFYANWYIPCAKTLALVDELTVTYGNKLTVLKVDVDSDIDMTNKYKIVAVPSFILFKEGQILWRSHGELSKVEMVNFIDGALNRDIA